MKIIFGLGNPGLKYSATRHNCGFLTVEKLADDLGAKFKRRKVEDNLIAEVVYQGDKLVLAKPQSFMNLSGFPLVRLCNYYKVDYCDILVIHDDLALPPGHLRFRRTGSDGGHNGMKSIIEQSGTKDINRLKIGIGAAAFATKSYVTGSFSAEEAPLFAQFFTLAAEASLCWLDEGISVAMNKYNNNEHLEK